jgi:hypothetical protein
MEYISIYCLRNYQQGKYLVNTSNPQKKDTKRGPVFPFPPRKQRWHVDLATLKKPQSRRKFTGQHKNNNDRLLGYGTQKNIDEQTIYIIFLFA